MASLAVPLAISGISALAGLFGNRPKTTTSTFDKTENQSGSSSTLPQYDPENLDFRNELIKKYMALLGQDTDLSGYKAQGINTINQGSNARQMGLQQILASRGLSYSPVAAYAPAQAESARIGDTAQFINSIPLLQRQMQLENLNAAGAYQRGLPVGESRNFSTTDTATGKTVGQESGNMLGGLLGGGGSALAYLYGKGAFGNKGTGGYD